MLMTFCSFLAIFALLLGRVYASAAGSVVQETPSTLGNLYRDTYKVPECEIEARLAEGEFLHRANWSAFSDDCCCRDRNGTAGVGRVELWTCPDISHDKGGGSILHKQRERARDLGNGCVADGLHMRPFCAREFTDGKLPAYDEVHRAWVVPAPPSAPPQTAACNGYTATQWAAERLVLDRDLW